MIENKLSALIKPLKIIKKNPLGIKSNFNFLKNSPYIDLKNHLSFIILVYKDLKYNAQLQSYFPCLLIFFNQLFVNTNRKIQKNY